MKAEQFSKDSQEFLRLLAKHEVRYVLIGGVAVIYHGYARLTGDVDFLYDRSIANVQRLWAALLEFWGGVVPALPSHEELMDPNIIVQFGRPPNRIDLIAGISSVTFGGLGESSPREHHRGWGGSSGVDPRARRTAEIQGRSRSSQGLGRPRAPSGVSYRSS